MLRKVSKVLGSGASLLALALVLLGAFGVLFYADDLVKTRLRQLATLNINAERVLSADLNATTAVRLAASLESDRYVLNYQDHQDAKYALLEEIAKLPASDEIRQHFTRMEDVQADIEGAETKAIALIDDEAWEAARELVTEPAFRRQKGIYRANLSSALRELILDGERQARQANDLYQAMQFGVLGMFLLLALIGVIYSREMQRSLKRQSELAGRLEDANVNLEKRVVERTAELKESQSLFKTVLDNMPAIVFLKSPAGEFQLVNKRYEEVYRVNLDDIRGKTLHDLYPRDVADEFSAIDRAVIAAGEVSETEHSESIDGRDTVMSSVMFPIHDSRGRLTGYGGIEIDITDRKAAERALAAKEAQLRAALGNMSDGIFVLDAELNYALFNERYLELVELPPDVVAHGKPVSRAVATHAERGDYGDGDPREIVERRLIAIGDDRPVESEMTINGGARILSLRKMPMEGGAVVVLSDITQRKVAEAELAREKAVLDATLETMDQGISMVDENLDMLAFNAKFNELLDIPAGLFPPGTSLEALFRYNAARGEYGDEDEDEAVRLRMELSRAFEPHQFERTRPDGTVIEIRGNPLPDGAGFVTTYTDITERKRAEERLRETFDIIANSINYASHIQRSVLPGDTLFSAILSDYFIIWEPRDVVGGDLYWCRIWGDGLLMILGDCTGHGVPGAFMTLIATGALDNALTDVPPGRLGDLIQRIHQIVQSTLGQHGDKGTSDDGMEMGAVFLNADGDELVFAGARFELFLVEHGTVSVIKGTRSGIGYRGIRHNQEFEEHRIVNLAPKSFVMASDGLTDQVGAETGRMYGKRRLKALLADLEGESMAEHETRIRQSLADYQGTENRRDDVSVLGFRV